MTLRIEVAKAIAAMVELSLKRGDKEHGLFLPLSVSATQGNFFTRPRYLHFFFFRPMSYTLVAVRESEKNLSRLCILRYETLVYHDGGSRDDTVRMKLRDVERELGRIVAPASIGGEPEFNVDIIAGFEVAEVQTVGWDPRNLAVPTMVSWKN